MRKSTYYRNGYRLKHFLRGNTLDDSMNLVTEHICSHTEAYRKVMAFIDKQHPSDEYQATYYMDTIIRLVVLSDEQNNLFLTRNHPSGGYVRMCKLARIIRDMINEEEEQL